VAVRVAAQVETEDDQTGIGQCVDRSRASASRHSTSPFSRNRARLRTSSGNMEMSCGLMVGEMLRGRCWLSRFATAWLLAPSVRPVATVNLALAGRWVLTC
jgi:hypothetical protein